MKDKLIDQVLTYRDLKNKIAIVTGGAGGLGSEIVLELCKSGVIVIIADKDELKSKKLEEKIKSISQIAESYKLDVRNYDEIRSMCTYIINKYKSIDILVNVAGITIRKFFLDFDEKDFDDVIDINLKGTFLCSKEVCKYMVKTGRGKVINLSSIGGSAALKNSAVYCSSKGGVEQLTRVMAIDLAQYNINVNAIAPCLANTPIAKTVFKDEKTLEWFTSKIPMGRLCQPKDIAYAMLFLASSASDYITGHILAVDGGYLAQ